MADYWTLKIYAEKILQTKLTLIYGISQEQNTENSINNIQFDLLFFIFLSHFQISYLEILFNILNLNTYRFILFIFKLS